jgi:hypothetical protein
MLFAGCATYGGSLRVKLAADPPGSEVFLVPKGDWDRLGGPAILADRKRLNGYPHGNAPAELRARDYVYVVVCRGGAVQEIEPVMNGANEFKVDCR